MHDVWHASLARALDWADIGDSRLSTPVVLVDYDRAAGNAERAQAYCNQHDLRFRPHVKTHKTAMFAQMQTAIGAVGVTCQTIEEAQSMVAAGIADILITYPILGSDKVRSLGQIARRARLAVAADSQESVVACAEAAAQAGQEIGFLVECDTGLGRLGVQSPDQAAWLAGLASATAGVRFRGLMAYPTSPQTSGFFRASIEALARAGLSAEVRSAGSTPTLYHTHELSRGLINEVRAGEYLFGDRTHLALGVVSPDELAAVVRSTVVGRPTATRAILDAGSKALSSDAALAPGLDGFGVIAEFPGAVIYELSEEHAHVDLSHCESAPAIGARVSLVPNHICPCVNLMPYIAVRRFDDVEIVPVVGRRGAAIEASFEGLDESLSEAGSNT
jgi:D-serine deaminase-like pyridoxal phosphate-dependent protein